MGTTAGSYTLVQLGDDKYLFTPVGYEGITPFAEMRIFRFSKEEFSFHILHINDNQTMVFGDEKSFYDWLKAQGVATEEHEILNYAVVEPMSKMRDLTCSTKDDLLVKMSVSSLNMSGSGSIMTKGEPAKLIHQFHLGDDSFLPLLTKLKDEKPEILWHAESENGEEPEIVSDFKKEREAEEKSNNTIGCIVAIVIAIVFGWIAYSGFVNA
ncbi:MAG: hypothetical protein ABJN36_09315 [Cyclobacteriaceae bacterium]